MSDGTGAAQMQPKLPSLKSLEDIGAAALDELAQPYVDEPIVFKFGGFDDTKTYQKKKAAGNDLGLNSGEGHSGMSTSTPGNGVQKKFMNVSKIKGMISSGLVQMVQNAFAKAGVKYPITSGRTSTSGLRSEKYTT